MKLNFYYRGLKYGKDCLHMAYVLRVLQPLTHENFKFEANGEDIIGLVLQVKKHHRTELT